MRLPWRSLLFEKNDSTVIQFFRYAIVGGLAFVLDFGAFYLLLSVLSVQYLLSAAIAFSFGLAANYLISIAWVFNRRAMNDARAEFAMYLVLGIAGLAITELTLYLLTGLMGIHALPSKLVATAITFFWNFWSRKIALFTVAEGTSRTYDGRLPGYEDPAASFNLPQPAEAESCGRCAPAVIAD